jgi:hypothetical protein
MRAHRLTLAALPFVLLTSPLLRAQAPAPAPAAAAAPAPAEAYTATLQIKGPATASTTLHIDLPRYSSARDREPVETGFKHGGYPGFLTALRKTRKVGTVSTADKTWDIRWASAKPTPSGGRKIVLITDRPMFFLGGGAAGESKSRAGYEIGVIQLDVDAAGTGAGSVAAAAKVKPGDDGVIVDDYGDQRIEITKVVREKP